VLAARHRAAGVVVAGGKRLPVARLLDPRYTVRFCFGK
jgi:hypothetical protein